MGREPFTDFYEVLQVSPSADQETIERVYRLLARRYHPDNQSTGDAQKFDMITKAYRTLSSPKKGRATMPVMNRERISNGARF